MSISSSQAQTREGQRGGVPVAPLLFLGGAIFLLVVVLRYNAADPWAAPILGLMAACYPLALSSPVWALIGPLFNELTVMSYFLSDAGVSVRLLSVAGGLLTGGLAILRANLFSDAIGRRVLLPAIGLIVVATAVDVISTDVEYTIKYLRYQLVQLAALLLAASVVRERRDLKRLAIAGLVIGLVVAFVGVWQHYERESAPFVGTSPAAVAGYRAYGLSPLHVLFANVMLWVLVPLLGWLLRARWQVTPRLVFLGGGALLMLSALNFSYTRSSMLALGPALLTIGLFVSPGRRRLLFVALVGAAFAYLILQGTGLIGQRYYRSAGNDKSAADHLVLLDVGVRMALDNPVIGIGHQAFEEVSTDYADEVSSADSAGPNGLNALGRLRPHNDFLLVWISWGIVALIAYCWLFAGALANFVVATRNGDPLVGGLAVGGAGALAAYAANSFFHNYMDSSSLFWLFAGLSIALARLPSRTDPRDRVERLYPTRRAARLARRGRRFAAEAVG